MKQKYSDLKPEQVDYVLVKTTSAGPFSEDVFFLVFSSSTDGFWQIPGSSGSEFLNWLYQFPDINLEEFTKSQFCTDDRIFILYRGTEHPVLSARLKQQLKNRLLNLLSQNFSGSIERLAKISDEIFSEYGNDRRYYHNLEHIQHSLWELDQVTGIEADKAILELAIWYHDLVYLPLSKNNEAESAKRLIEDLGELPTHLNLEEISKLILCTPITARTELEKLFLDIDYSILGQREIEYMVYSQNVRLEVQSVPSLVYHLKRKAFLKSCLKRSVFFTSWFKDRYENQAKNNLKTELSKMPYRILPTIPNSFC